MKITLLLSLLLLPFVARAADEVSVLDPKLESSHYEISLMSGYKQVQGSFDPYGVYGTLPSGSQAWALMEVLGVSYRFSETWEGTLSLPYRHSEMYLPSGSSNSTSVGGTTIGSRYHLGGPAHVVIHGSVGTPWRSSDRSSVGDPGASLPPDSNDGYTSGTSVSLGVGGSQAMGDFRFALDLSDTYSLPTDQTLSDAPNGTPAVTLQNGNRLGLSEGLSYRLNELWRLNGGLRQSWTADQNANGKDVAGSASRVFSTSAGISYLPSPAWRVAVNYETLYPFYAYAANQSYGPGISLLLIYVGDRRSL